MTFVNVTLCAFVGAAGILGLVMLWMWWMDRAADAQWERETLPVHPTGAMSKIVYCHTTVYCRWCGGTIRKYVSGVRLKRFTRDTDDHESKEGYHEVCWCEAIEVQA